MRDNAQLDGRPLDGSEVQSKVHGIKFACAGVSVVCNTFFRFTMSCCIPEIFTIKSQSCLKSCQNFGVFGLQNFGGRGHPNF